MTLIDTIKVLLLHAKHSSSYLHFSVTTTYGLVVDLSSDEPLRIRLAKDKQQLPAVQTVLQVPASSTTKPSPDITPEQQPKMREVATTQGPQSEPASLPIHQEILSETECPPPCQPQYGPHLPGFKYYISPDFGTNFMWYDWGWPGNPEGGVDVADDELEERYSKNWCNAYVRWVDQYSEAFETRECHLGADNDVFPDVEERYVWLIEGALLAAWLALQDGVHEVLYGPENDDNYQFRFERDEIDKTLCQFIHSIKLE
ncbi:uncharacterized protein CTRU02_209352 [Colletotrichum truncatum]|uniref:Uncharacterized protein n=1 Tax=Colletotrichum truncatum TaxID=5467 RepID=A0ACC3YTH0_COLTU|nr:uncharacterized protein CTRU02_08574 [Colletotrichum truncatum]KAF6789875.1 hypothetical protein CTRU02_08574 [Colletotrichum truncatum]